MLQDICCSYSCFTTLKNDKRITYVKNGLGVVWIRLYFRLPGIATGLLSQILVMCKIEATKKELLVKATTLIGFDCTRYISLCFGF